MIAYNRTRDRLLASKVFKADTAWTRARGLLGRGSLEPQEAMWIAPCAMIHTFFMRFNIDVVFLDGGLRVVRVSENIRPWRVSPWVPRARSVLELMGGTIKGSVQTGDRVELR